MSTPPTGPRPPTTAEWEAYTLHLQRIPVAAIEEQTRLSRPQIAAAVDLGQLHAQAALQPLAVHRKPAAASQPVRIRRAVIPQLPGATVPPSPMHAAPPRPPAISNAEPIPPAPAPAGPDPDLTRSPTVRAWASAEGWTVPPGRLPGAIVLAYLKAHGGNQ